MAYMSYNKRSELRRSFEKRADFFGKICLKLGLSPNILTGISFLCAVNAGICFWQKWTLIGVAMMLLTVLTDALDGATARANKLVTAFGGILDHVSDRYGEAFILIGLSLSGMTHPVWATFALSGMIIASYTREAAEAIGKIQNVDVGAVGRMEKFIIIIIGIVIKHYLPRYNLLTYALIIVGILSYITSIQRLIYVKRVLSGRKRNK